MSKRAALASDTGGWKIAGRVIMVLVIIGYGFPIVWMVMTSLKTTPDTVVVTWWPSEWVFDAYTAFFASDFLPAFQHSMQIAVVTVIMSLGLAIPAAFGLSRSKSRLITPAMLFIVLVQIIPATITFIPLLKILAQMRILDTYLGVSVAQCTLIVPFAILLLRPGFTGIPVEIEEAAKLDGAGNVRYLFRIALPLLRNSTLVIGAICFVASWGDLVYPITLLVSSDKYPLSGYIVEAVGRFGGNANLLMAVSVLVAVPTLIVVLLAQRQLKAGLTMGAVK